MWIVGNASVFCVVRLNIHKSLQRKLKNCQILRLKDDFMNVNWLFENDTFGEDCVTQLVEEVERQGMQYTYAAKVPMRSDETYLDLFPPKSCVVFYGSLGFANQIRREASWIPGV